MPIAARTSVVRVAVEQRAHRGRAPRRRRASGQMITVGSSRVRRSITAERDADRHQREQEQQRPTAAAPSRAARRRPPRPAHGHARPGSAARSAYSSSGSVETPAGPPVTRRPLPARAPAPARGAGRSVPARRARASAAGDRAERAPAAAVTRSARRARAGPPRRPRAWRPAGRRTPVNSSNWSDRLVHEQVEPADQDPARRRPRRAASARGRRRTSKTHRDVARSGRPGRSSWAAAGIVETTTSPPTPAVRQRGTSRRAPTGARRSRCERRAARSGVAGEHRDAARRRGRRAARPVEAAVAPPPRIVAARTGPSYRSRTAAAAPGQVGVVGEHHDAVARAAGCWPRRPAGARS